MMDMIGDICTVWEKDMRVWFKEPLFGFVRILIMPLIWMIIFGNIFGGNLSNLPVAVVDYDHSILSQKLVNGITDGRAVTIRTMANYEDALEMFQARQVFAIIIIPRNFEQEMQLNLILDQSSPSISSAIDASVSRAVSRISSSGSGIYVARDIKYGRGASYMDFLAPAVIIQTIAFAAVFSGGMSILLERQSGALNMLLVSPISGSSILLGKIFSGVTQAIIGGIAAFLIALVLGVKVKTGLLGLGFAFVVMILLAFSFIGLSVAIASSVKDLQSFSMVLMLLIMPLWILSGSLYPVEGLPWWLAPISIFDPLTYAVDAMRNIMIRGFTFWSIFFDLVVLSLFGVVMFMLGISTFKRSVE